MTDITITGGRIVISHDIADMDPNVLGEFLREGFWPRELNEGNFGCYSGWTYSDRVIESTLKNPREAMDFFLEGIPEDDVDQLHEVALELMQMGVHHVYRYMGDMVVDCFWYWDGDGTLAFRIGHHGVALRTIINTDCKKSYGWRDR